MAHGGGTRRTGGEKRGGEGGGEAAKGSAVAPVEQTQQALQNSRGQREQQQRQRGWQRERQRRSNRKQVASASHSRHRQERAWELGTLPSEHPLGLRAGPLTARSAPPGGGSRHDGAWRSSLEALSSGPLGVMLLMCSVLALVLMCCGLVAVREYIC